MIIKSSEPMFSEFPLNTVIGITSGCFDLLHPLHIQYLEKCKRECDYLLVYVDSDKFINSHKDWEVVINEDDRCYMLDALGCVDTVGIIQNPEDFKKQVNHILSNISSDMSVKIFKNASEIYGQPTFEFEGAELVIIPDVKRFSSTTEIKEFLINKGKTDKENELNQRQTN